LFFTKVELGECVPLISFGGKTTPAGALISSSAAMASPFVAEGAMLRVEAMEIVELREDGIKYP
jgi:hypothetical protein